MGRHNQARGTSNWDSAKAGLRGVVDSVPFGLGDYTPAVVNAIIDAAHGKSFQSAFDRRLKAEHAQNRYDEAVHPYARLTGKAAGTLAQTAVPGLALAKTVSVPRMAVATRLMASEAGKLAGMGAGVGVGTQGVGDIVRGKRGSLGDYAGSAIGGAAGVAAALAGKPHYVGAVTGGVAAGVQDLLDHGTGSQQDLARLASKVSTGAADGNVALLPAFVLMRKIEKARPKTKGDIGEMLALQRTRLRGESVVAGPRKQDLVGGRYTIVDHRTRTRAGNGIAEAKFGASYAKKGLSGSQTIAKAQYGDLYRVDHFLPRDVLAGASVPTGSILYQFRQGNRSDRPVKKGK
jgi:hypothetical protein